MATASAQRREREKQEVRQLMLDAARDIMINEGPDAVSMRRIAEKIHYSPTALYVHFADKTALLAELCGNDFRLFASRFIAAAAEPDPIERLRVAGRLFLQFGMELPHHFRLMFMVPLPPEEFEKIHAHNIETKGDSSQDAYAFLRIIVGQAIDSGRCKPEHRDVDLIAQLLWSSLHGIISLRIAHGNSKWMEWRSVDQLANHAIDALLSWLTGKDECSTESKVPVRKPSKKPPKKGSRS